MIGQRLEQLRKTKVISQRQLALAIGVASTTISRYERDLFKPKENVLIRLADFFQVDVGVFHQSIDSGIASMHYVSHPNQLLPMKVKHKIEADLQMQIECWETLELHLDEAVAEDELIQQSCLAELAESTQLDELVSSAVKAWLSFDDTTKDLTRFIEWLGLRVLLTNEIDPRFEGLGASSVQHSYLLVSMGWSDEKRRRYLAKMLGSHILRSHSTLMPTEENLDSFATKFLQQATANVSTVAPRESTPKFGIKSPVPELKSPFAELVLAAWSAEKITNQTAAALLRTTERDLQSMKSNE